LVGSGFGTPIAWETPSPAVIVMSPFAEADVVAVTNPFCKIDFPVILTLPRSLSIEPLFTTEPPRFTPMVRPRLVLSRWSAPFR
jgi:hypothetical protein